MAAWWNGWRTRYLRPALLACAGAVSLNLLPGCAETVPEDWKGPVWGPLVAGDCGVSSGTRRYSAQLYGGGSACEGPPRNVLGANFAIPDGCREDIGYWHVKDHTCDNGLPPLPGRGSDGAPAEPAEGFADLHNHLLAHVAFGESVFWGASFGEPEQALAPIADPWLGPHQRVEALSSSGSIWSIFDGHDEQGHPRYSGWPKPHLKTHQQSHVDWLYRAYQGGLRLLVVPAVNNQDMFGRGENRLSVWLKPLLALFGANAEPMPHRTSNDMEALEHQVLAAHALEEWVERHRGGWLEIAQTPEEAAALIEAGKMALVLGSEVDHPLNCDLGRRCSRRHIQEGLTKLEALGIAVLFPSHHKETQFGDSANFQPLNTGPLRACPAFNAPCAARGLTAKGAFLVKEMMQRGMLVDLGHAGQRPFEHVMQLLEPNQYPAFMSHASAHPLKPAGSAEYTLTYPQLRRIAAVGGMVSLHSAQGEYAGLDNSGVPMPFASTDGGAGYTQAFLYTRDALEGGYMDAADLRRGGQFAFAADWNGFASWPSGRFSDAAAPLREVEAIATPFQQPPRLIYPFPLPSNLVPAAVGGVQALDVMDFSGVTFDFNESGLAHAGLAPDLLEDMRLHGLSEADLDPFYRSARGFIDMWQRARAAVVPGDRGWLRWLPQSATDLLPFSQLAADRLVEVVPGVPICRARGSGKVGALRNGACQLIEADEPETQSPTYIGEIRNANSGQCLSIAAGSKRSGAAIEQRPCSDHGSQAWQVLFDVPFEGQAQLRAVHSQQCMVLRGSALEQSECAADSVLQLERVGNTYRFRMAPDRCVHIEDRSLDAHARALAVSCPPPGRADFHWEIDALRDALDYERLYSTRRLDGTVRWAVAAPSGMEEAVTTRSGARLCRSRFRLGSVSDGRCLVPGATGSPATYETLWSTTRLVH